MEKKIVFRDSEQISKYTLVYTDYGFKVMRHTPNAEICLFCFGDSRQSCVIMQRNNKPEQPFKIMFARPHQALDDLTYPTKRWAEMAAQLRMIKKTPYGRQLIAKPIVDLNHVYGVRILYAESEKDQALPLVDIVVHERKNASPSLQLKWNLLLVGFN